MTADPDGSNTGRARPGGTCERRRAWRMTLPPARQAAGEARQATRKTLAAWGIGHLEEPATLLVSELVSNAIQHASASRLPLELRLETSGAWLRIEVLDADPCLPQPRTADELDESGRGFVLVEAIADKWGASPAAAGKTVWAELDTSAGRIPTEAAGALADTEAAEP
jgi:anti-sigma regulatory factor (Ser/Thr protein kinase)